MADGASDPHILGPGLLPTPFTADEIRDGCPVGRLIRLLVEVDGEEPTLRTNRFSACDAEGAMLEVHRFAMDGTPLAPPESHRTTWLGFQRHAAFPADRTTVATETVELPIGTLECLRFTAVEGDTTSTFWFAKSLPGMPARYESEVGGRIISRVTMLEKSVS